MIQLHGDEHAEFCLEVAKLNLPIIKAFRVKNTGDLLVIDDYKDIISYILLDTYSDSLYGGTGNSFDWDVAVGARDYNIPVILAGGLTPENIAEANRKVQPYALDVSSGVEVDKGIKDHSKLEKLFYIINKPLF